MATHYKKWGARQISAKVTLAKLRDFSMAIVGETRFQILLRMTNLSDILNEEVDGAVLRPL